ncbi:MAG: phosphoglycerate kinase [Nocardioidaceae bacterium]|nr:phosphoglycerate kinase [Nocardioidaceae bacterium]
MRSIDDLGDLSGRAVLVRSDLNVPLDGDAIGDDGRIRASVPTLQRLRDARARVVVVAHLGRPDGGPDERFTLAPAARRLGELLGAPVRLAGDVVGDSARAMVDGLSAGDVGMLENVRFETGETSDDDDERAALADRLATLADVFVSDGFGVVHRKQASVYDVAQRLPSAAGLLIEAEVKAFGRLVDNPEHPYVVVLGGSKVSDKLGVIDNLLDLADVLLVGGGMVFTFLAALGHPVGRSLLEADQVDSVRGYLDRASNEGVRIVLPTDVVVADAADASAKARVVPAGQMPDDLIGLDIGPAAAEGFAAEIAKARTVFWNGPMGVFEIEQFAHGTSAVGAALAASEGLTVLGGGDSAAAVRALGFSDDAFGHVSTGGGAGLELLEGKTLPGLSVLEG